MKFQSDIYNCADKYPKKLDSIIKYGEKIEK